MTEEEIIKILIRFHEYLSLSNVFIAVLRTVGWYFLIGLAECVDALSGGVSSIYELINFYDSPAIDDFLTKYMPVIFSMAALALGFLGWKIIIKKQTDYSKIITSSIVALTIFLVLPWGMQKASDLVSLGRESLESENLTVSTKIFQNNITDVYKIDQAGWSLKELDKMKRQNNIRDKTDVHFVDINEVVDTGGLWKKSPLTEDGKAILTKKVSDASGKRTLEDLQSRWISDDEAYNRYSWHPWYIFFELVTIGIVLFMTMFRTAQMIMELGILKIFSMGTAFTDLESGQRNKRIIEKIRNTFIVMFAMVLILECFIIFTDFVGQSSLNGAVKIVALFAAGILTIDGPAFIDELFGIDAGVKSIGRSLLGAFALGRSAKGAAAFAGGLASKAAKTGMKIGKKTAGGALMTAGATKGLLDGYKERGQQQGTSSAPGGSSPLSKTKATAPYNVLNSDKLKDALNGEETGQNGAPGKPGGEETPLGGDGAPGKPGGEETPLGGDGAPGKPGGGETPLGGDGAPGKPG
ncbi:pLS20_p028 family conjugation system transmembrane protein, partial [Bacillus altitudinis]|uniref:pLS20_p028 family conjugation system transmembrane protein n=3 Tax=Bacillus TaxID=1386 RepID=UPI003F7CACE6